MGVVRGGADADRCPVPPPRGRGFLLVLAAVLATSLPAAAADPGPTKLVVAVHPNESDGAPGVILADRAIRATFAAEAPFRVELRNEYVDTSRLGEADFKAAQLAFLRHKYAGRKVDLVFAGLSSGLDFVLASRDDLFPGVPVVFIAVDEREVAARRLPPDVMGVPIRMDLAGTLDIALRLHPDARRVYVVSGSSPYDAEWEAEARRVFGSLEGRTEFVYLAGLPMEELLARVADLPGNSLIYYLHMFRDGAGITLVPAEALERIAARASAPIYGHVGTYVGRGIVGGRVFDFEAEGRNAARLGLRVLARDRPDAIPAPAGSANADVFDGHQLRRWGIDERRLPPGSVVRNKEPTLWDRYRWHVAAGAALCVIEGVLIAGLLLQRRRRRRADERFRQVVETAPTGMLLIGQDGKVLMANGEAERLFGYTRAELLGRSLEMLVPERVRADYRLDREWFAAGPAIRPMRLGRDLWGRRKDGAEFPVDIGLSPLPTAQGWHVLAVVVDLSERRRADEQLRTSRRELRVLTGRLLEAQEVERRRIARELHDDLNQGLALLAVELEVLGQRPPAPPDAAKPLRALAARAKDLSSAVHALSHQLHPSRLEQLGLVTAVRGLCKEVARHHNLGVEFTPDDVPQVIPDGVALCLYRIVQEALQNVVKHSGSRRAVVELRRTPVALHLRVSDDGAGFDPVARNGGLGLMSMRERLHAVGGEMTIDSRPGGGTRLDVRVPAAAAERPHGVPFHGILAAAARPDCRVPEETR